MAPISVSKSTPIGPTTTINGTVVSYGKGVLGSPSSVGANPQIQASPAFQAKLEQATKELNAPSSPAAQTEAKVQEESKNTYYGGTGSPKIQVSTTSNSQLPSPTESSTTQTAKTTPSSYQGLTVEYTPPAHYKPGYGTDVNVIPVVGKDAQNINFKEPSKIKSSYQKKAYSILNPIVTAFEQSQEKKEYSSKLLTLEGERELTQDPLSKTVLTAQLVPYRVSESTAGFISGYGRGIIDDPEKIAASAAVALATSAILPGTQNVITAGSAKLAIPAAGSAVNFVISKALPTAYFGGLAVDVSKSESLGEGFGKLGKATSTEILPFIAGGKIAQIAGAKPSKYESQEAFKENLNREGSEYFKKIESLKSAPSVVNEPDFNKLIEHPEVQAIVKRNLLKPDVVGGGSLLSGNTQVIPAFQKTNPGDIDVFSDKPGEFAKTLFEELTVAKTSGKIPASTELTSEIGIESGKVYINGKKIEVHSTEWREAFPFSQAPVKTPSGIKVISLYEQQLRNLAGGYETGTRGDYFSSVDIRSPGRFVESSKEYFKTFKEENIGESKLMNYRQVSKEFKRVQLGPPGITEGTRANKDIPSLKFNTRSQFYRLIGSDETKGMKAYRDFIDIEVKNFGADVRSIKKASEGRYTSSELNLAVRKTFPESLPTSSDVSKSLSGVVINPFERVPSERVTSRFSRKELLPKEERYSDTSVFGIVPQTKLPVSSLNRKSSVPSEYDFSRYSRKIVKTGLGYTPSKNVFPKVTYQKKEKTSEYTDLNYGKNKPYNPYTKKSYNPYEETYPKPSAPSKQKDYKKYGEYNYKPLPALIYEPPYKEPPYKPYKGKPYEEKYEPPYQPPKRIRGFGGGGLELPRSKRSLVFKTPRKYRYTPSLTAIGEGIKAKKGFRPTSKTQFSGLEIRPLLSRKGKIRGEL